MLFFQLFGRTDRRTLKTPTLIAVEGCFHPQIAAMSSHLRTWCVWRTCVATWRHPRPCGRPCGPCRRWPVVVGSRWTCCRRPPAVWRTWPKRVRHRRGPRTGKWTTVCRTSASATRQTQTSRWLSSPTAPRRPCPVPWALENDIGLNWTADSLRLLSRFNRILLLRRPDEEKEDDGFSVRARNGVC